MTFAAFQKKLANVPTAETTNNSSPLETPAQDRLLASIANFTKAKKMPPSLDELAKLNGVGRSSARAVVMRLKRRGLVDLTPGAHRSLAITRSGRLALNNAKRTTN